MEAAHDRGRDSAAHLVAFLFRQNRGVQENLLIGQGVNVKPRVAHAAAETKAKDARHQRVVALKGTGAGARGTRCRGDCSVTTQDRAGRLPKGHRCAVGIFQLLALERASNEGVGRDCLVGNELRQHLHTGRALKEGRLDALIPRKHVLGKNLCGKARQGK